MVLAHELDEKVTLENYNPAWAAWYDQEAERILAVFPHEKMVAIEHFGSTAVPGMLAKPVVDILIGLEQLDLSEQEQHILAQLGYAYYGATVPGLARLYARKRADKNFNLSFVVFKSPEWANALALRDHLRTSEGVCCAYCQVKSEAVKHAEGMLLGYSAYKAPFLNKVLRAIVP